MDVKPGLLTPFARERLLTPLAFLDTTPGKIEDERCLAAVPQLPAIGSKQHGTLALQQAEDAQKITVLCGTKHRLTSMDRSAHP